VADAVVWDSLVAAPTVLRRGADSVAINARDQVLLTLERRSGAEVVDLDTGAVTVLRTPADAVGLYGGALGDDLVFGEVVLREADPDDEGSSAETVSFVYDLRSGVLTRLAAGPTQSEVARHGLSTRDEVLLGLHEGTLVVPTLDVPDQYGPGEVFDWFVNSEGLVYGTSTYPAPEACHTDFPCRHVYAWDPASGLLEDLGTPGSEHPAVADVNDLGQIVVQDGGPDPLHASVPWVWRPDVRRWIELPCPADATQCTPTAIGEDATVYGQLPEAGGFPLDGAASWPPSPPTQG
jgi:hypothetical protein